MVLISFVHILKIHIFWKSGGCSSKIYLSLDERRQNLPSLGWPGNICFKISLQFNLGDHSFTFHFLGAQATWAHLILWIQGDQEGTNSFFGILILWGHVRDQTLPLAKWKNTVFIILVSIQGTLVSRLILAIFLVELDQNTLYT